MLKGILITLLLVWVPITFGDGSIHDVTTEDMDRVQRIRQAAMSGQWPEDLGTPGELLDGGNLVTQLATAKALVDAAHRDDCKPEVRQEYVEMLATRLQSGMHLAVRQKMVRYLAAFKKQDFTEVARKAVGEKFKEDAVQRGRLSEWMVYLVAVTEIEEAVPVIEKLAASPLADPDSGRFAGYHVWAAHSVMARRGDQKALKRIITYIRDTPERIQAITRLLPQLQYIEQTSVVALLKEVLESDERLPQVKSTVKGTPVANYAAYTLGRMLQGFPVVKEEPVYSQAEIARCRTWLAKQRHYRFASDVEGVGNMAENGEAEKATGAK